ncbi:MAG: Tm-1-like ATP-binding domain-containing protein [Rhodobacteraceae bacterium]|nr:Tm-1-like ATP-binding domain-containing protein [Paracoccaceae bacterium]
MTSLGSSCLYYMKRLRQPLEDRGFDVAVFHATGMGGMAFESLAREGFFAAVMDFALPELGNLMVGSVANGGADRLTSAGRRGIPQIVAPGCTDLIDFAAWQEVPARFADRPFHAHNRLIASAGLTGDERRELVRDIAGRLEQATAPVTVILPNRGIEEWDKAGEAAHDPEGLAAMLDEFRKAIKPPAELVEINAHINDQEFADTALAILDGWIAKGIVKTSL